MTTPNAPTDLRDELEQLEQQIAELQRHVDELRSDDADPADRAATINQAEQQQALISQLDVRRRDLMDKLADS